jgi:hypothetical protein
MATRTDDPLRVVRRATGRRALANINWRTAIVDAHTAGKSLRQIATVAGVNHVRVLQILNEEKDR